MYKTGVPLVYVILVQEKRRKTVNGNLGFYLKFGFGILGPFKFWIWGFPTWPTHRKLKEFLREERESFTVNSVGHFRLINVDRRLIDVNQC